MAYTVPWYILTHKGRSEPIPLPEMMNGLGLGKANIETRMLQEVINQGPRILESQKIAEENEEQRQLRQVCVECPLPMLWDEILSLLTVKSS